MRARDRWEGSSSDKGLEEAVPGPECEDDMMVNKEIFLHVPLYERDKICA